jgi:lysyl-tRNA synthetase, class I
MKLRIEKEIFALVPELSVGIIVLKGLDNSKSVTLPFDKIYAKLREQYGNSPVSEVPVIAKWRSIYSSFGTKAKKSPCSVEALLKRIVKGGDLPSINPLVNIYNYMSLKSLMPMGADNLDKISGDVLLARATGDESFIAIGVNDIVNPKSGEVVYKDSEKVLCRKWNFRECDESKLTKDTKNAILYVEDVTNVGVESVIEELNSIIKENLGITGVTATLNIDANEIDLDTLKTSSTFDKSKLPKKEEKVVEKSVKKKKKDTRDSENREIPLHWADQTARKIIAAHPDKKNLTCAAGITPSGVVHIGNFREIITVELISRAVKKAIEGTDKSMRFIYSWDDYDVFRKIPKNMPKQDMLKKYLRQPIVDVPDPFGKEESYARHNQIAVEKEMPKLGIKPEYIYQSKMYRSCVYADGMKVALEHTKEIKEILDKYRKEPLPDDFSPVRLFCEKCNKDTITSIKYNGEYSVSYECECGFSNTFDLRKNGIAKLQWRVDWPMRWKHEEVDFEPGGKDHSSPGGSYDTGKQISSSVYAFDAPLYIMYDFIRIKGGGGKISSSSGDVITIHEVLEIFEAEMTRWLFAGTRPGTEFAISFDVDVIKLYEDFDKCERIYYGTQSPKNDKEKAQQSRIYELSAIDSKDIPKKAPFQPSFRHLTTIVQICEHDIEAVAKFYEEKEGVKDATDLERVKLRAACASNWLKKYAPEDMVFNINSKTPDVKISTEIKPAFAKLIELLGSNATEDEIGPAVFNFCKENDIPIKEFFQAAYQILINKERGPKLVPFIFSMGKEKAVRLLKEAT